MTCYACKHIQAIYKALRLFVDGVDIAIEVEIIKKPAIRSNSDNGRTIRKREKQLFSSPKDL